MRLLPALLSSVLLLAGCQQAQFDEPTLPDESKLFGPTALRIHPIFTSIKDWTGDGNPDGIEVLLEFQDQFGDPTKAAGTVMFELYDYRRAQPDPRGPRLVNPWIGSIVTVSEQEARWNRTSRTYAFQLALPEINPSRHYVLAATFRSSTGGRYFDRAVIGGQEEQVAPVQPQPEPASPLQGI